MKAKKELVLPILGMLILLLFIGLSYTADYLFMEKLIYCAVVLGIIFLIRLAENRPGKFEENSGYDNLQNF